MRTLTTVVLAAGLLAVAEPAAAVPPAGMSAAAMNTMFNTYGNQGGHWTGGDNTASVELPDGRVAWLFADTMLGTVNADHSRPPNQPMVNNTIVVQDGTALTTTLHGGTPQGPEALVKPTQSGEIFWAADGTVEGNTLKVLYNRIRTTGTGALDFEQTGVALGTFALPALTLTSVVDLPLGPNISWGAGIFPDGAWTYIYGISSAPGRLKFAHLARVPAGGLSGAWEFWTGSGWSPDVADVGRLISGVDGGGVQKVGDQYVWVTHENNLIFDPQFVAYTSPSPTGPFSGPIPLFSAPESQTEGLIVYDARVHPELARSGKLLVSYNVNSLLPGGTTTDVRHGRPRFVEVDWPRPAPPAGRPGAPAAPTVTASDDTARLSWPAVSGATSYRVYQRNLTGGQTHFARLPGTVTSPSASAGFLVPGHAYEFKVTAANANGEGPFSPVTTVTPRNTEPVTEAVNGAGLPTAVAGTYIVQLNETTPEGAVDPYARLLAGQYGGQVLNQYPDIRAFAASLTEAQAHNLAGHPDVRDIEQDQRIEVEGVQSPTPSWGLDRIDSRIRAYDSRYEYPNDGTVDAYVIDTGVRANHVAFGGRVQTGYNVFTQGTDTTDCGTYHGTHVAGIIGSVPYGVARGARIIPVKVFQCVGAKATGSIMGFIDGLQWVVDNAANDAVINMSLSSPVSRPRATAMDKLVATAVSEGHVVVVAAGNQATDAANRTPARAPAAITVGATDNTDARASFSNYGSALDLFAPGAGIVSTDGGSTSGSSTKSGTSMAAPHVAGAVAMIRTTHPDYDPAEVENVLINATTKNVVTDTAGSPSRLLYIEKAPTETPTGLTATANQDGTIGLRWNTVADQGAHYQVWSRDITAGEMDLVRWDDPVFATTATYRDAVVGHTYEFRVAAANGAGVGPQSAPAQATAFRPPPPAPTGLTAAARPDGTVQLAWTAATPGAWHYVYLRDLDAPGGAEPFTKLEWPVSSGPAFTASGLRHGHRYEFRVTALDTSGQESTPSNVATATPAYPPPSGPTNLVATADDRRVTLSWQSAGPDVWYGVEMRDVTAGEPAFTRLPLPITTCCTFVAGDLTNGNTYQFRVVALGGDGTDSAPSNVVSATPTGEPAPPPADLRATAGNGQVHLTWTASPQPDAWYWIESRPAGGAWTRLELPVSTCCEFTSTGLTNGTTYEFRVITIGAGGAPDSAPSNVASARPAAPPVGAPSNLRVAAGNARVDLTWTASTTPGSWYWVETRNVSAGQAWVRLEYPVTTCCSFASTGLTNGDTYEFRVVTVGAEGAPDSAPSNVASARPTAPRPAPPTNLRASAGNGRVNLTWTASTTPGSWYWIESRNASTGQSWQRVSAPVTTCCSFAATGLVNGDTYSFRVITIGGGGAPDSVYSNTVSARPVAPQPGAPTNLRATAGDQRVTLTWTGSSTPGAWYWVYSRVAGQSSWTKNSTPVTRCCSFVAGYLRNGTTYEFRVTTIGSGGAPDSAPSNVVSARPLPPFPQAPSGLSATPRSGGEARLTWAASSTAGVGYNVYQRIRYANGSGAWTKLPLPALTNSMTVGFLRYGYTYEFRVTAANAAGESAASNVATVLAIPTNQRTRCGSVSSNYKRTDDGGAIQFYNLTGSVCATRSNFSFGVEAGWRSGGREMFDAGFDVYMQDCSTGAETRIMRWHYEGAMGLTSDSRLTHPGLNPNHLYRFRLVGFGNLAGPGIIIHRFDFQTPPLPPGVIPFIARIDCI